MLKAITVISNNQKELEQIVAPKNEASEQGPVKIFRPHYPQQINRQSYKPNFRPQYQNYQPNYRQYQPNYRHFQPEYRPQQQYAPVLIFNESLEHILMLLDHFFYNEQPQTRNCWIEPSDSPKFVHPSYVNRPVYRFPTKNIPANLLRQGIVYDS